MQSTAFRKQNRSDPSECLTFYFKKYVLLNFVNEILSSVTGSVNEKASCVRVRIINYRMDGVHNSYLSSLNETVHALSKSRRYIGGEHFLVDFVVVVVNVIHAEFIHPVTNISGLCRFYIYSLW